MNKIDAPEAAVINVEVAYATPERQLVIALQVNRGTSIFEAAVLSHIAQKFPGLNLDLSAMGVFGKLEKTPRQRLAEEGDRIEIYRPLKIDPKEARKERARKAQSAKE